MASVDLTNRKKTIKQRCPCGRCLTVYYRPYKQKGKVRRRLGGKFLEGK